ATLSYESNQWETEGTLTKTGGTMSLDSVEWSLNDDTTFSSDHGIVTETLSLNNYLLTLASESSDLTVTDNLTFDDSDEQIITGLADLTLQGGLTLEDGLLSSTGGTVSLEKGGELSGGSFDVTDSTLKLGDNFTKTGGTLTTTDDGTVLELMNNLSMTSDTAISIKELELSDNTLTLGSDTTDLTVTDPITLNEESEEIFTQSADLTLKGTLSVDDGFFDSSSGTISLIGGMTQTDGTVNITHSTLKLNDDLSKTGGTMVTTNTSIVVLESLTLTSDSSVSAATIEWSESDDTIKLTLGSETSDFTLSDVLLMDDANAQLDTGDADLTVEGYVTLSEGKLESTGGTLTFSNGAVQSAPFEFDLGESILSLGAVYTKSGGDLESTSGTLDLSDNLTFSSDSDLNFYQLNLNNQALTLGENTDLQVTSSLTMDDSEEWVITGDSNLTLLGMLTVSGGGVTSTGGTISLLEGGDVSGSGKLDFSDSTWFLVGEFKKTSGTVTMSNTNLELGSNVTLTSDEALIFAVLNLNDYILTLGSEDSDLTVTEAITIDSSAEGISTGEADLILLSALTMSDGLLDS
ncbi:uncharacterized protein METZ01_LOCUS197346, partial [marine metagenome]